MLAGAERGISKANIVLNAGRDLDLSISIKRQRMNQGPFTGYDVFGRIETIYFEPDKGCQMRLEDAAGVGRRIYWPGDGPMIARSKPEGDLLMVSRLPLLRGYASLPDVPDPKRPAKNPYRVDRLGVSHLPEGAMEDRAPMKAQRLEMIASGKFKSFLVIHPISQIIVVTVGGRATWGTLGHAKMPISSLSSFDGTKMALLVDPRTGEMFFKGGRYDLGDRIDMDAVSR